MRTYRTGGFLRILFFVLFFLALFDAFFCCLFACLYLVVKFFLLLMLGIVDTHARELVLDGHNGMAQEHSALRALHDGQELLRCLRAETRAVAAVADRLCNAVGAAVDFRKDGCEQRRAARAELAAVLLVMLAAVNAEGFADVFLFLRDVVLNFGRFALREEA